VCTGLQICDSVTPDSRFKLNGFDHSAFQDECFAFHNDQIQTFGTGFKFQDECFSFYNDRIQTFGLDSCFLGHMFHVFAYSEMQDRVSLILL